MGAVKAVKHDITDPNSGRDLILNIARNQFKVPIVQSVAYPLESTPLSEDDNEASVWINDTRTWRDVYSLRDYNYLKIVVSGEVPAWSKENDKWVSKSSLEASAIETSSQTEDDDSELTMGTSSNTEKTIPTQVVPTTPVVEVATPSPVSNTEDEDDDLPF